MFFAAINPPVAPASFVAPTSHFSIGFNPSASYLQSVDPRLTQATVSESFMLIFCFLVRIKVF